VAAVRLNRDAGPRHCENKEYDATSGSPRADGAGRVLKDDERKACKH
jgi:hypothetical protein